MCLPVFLPGVGGFGVDKELYNDINNVTRGFYHPKGYPIAKCRMGLAGRIMFLLLFFVNMGCGYADKNV